MRIMNGSTALTPTLPLAMHWQFGSLCLGSHTTELPPVPSLLGEGWYEWERRGGADLKESGDDEKHR